MGIKQSIPIAVGYFSVSFTFGIMGAKSDLFIAAHRRNNIAYECHKCRSFAGLSIIASGASMVEMFLTLVIINLRYALMSLSLSRKSLSYVHSKKNAYRICEYRRDIFAVSITYTRK